MVVLSFIRRKKHVIERYWQDCQCCADPDIGGVGWCHGTCSRSSTKVKNLRRHIRDRLKREKMIQFISVIPETMNRSSSYIHAENHEKILSENMVFPSYNWWYLVLSELYVNSSSICFLGGYDHFTSKTFISWQWQKFHVKTLFSLTVTNHSCGIPLFVDGYESFTSKHFLSWRLRMFHVKTSNVLTVLNVSCPNARFNKRSPLPKS